MKPIYKPKGKAKHLKKQSTQCRKRDKTEKALQELIESDQWGDQIKPDTIEIAIKALEKQVSKSLKQRHYGDEGGTYVKYTCPNGCNIQLSPITSKNFSHEHHYCHRCGQKIKSEVKK